MRAIHSTAAVKQTLVIPIIGEFVRRQYDQGMGQISTAGMCHGLSYMYAHAAMENQGHVFLNKLRLLIQYPQLLNGDTEAALRDRNLWADCKELFNIPASADQWSPQEKANRVQLELQRFANRIAIAARPAAFNPDMGQAESQLYFLSRQQLSQDSPVPLNPTVALVAPATDWARLLNDVQLRDQEVAIVRTYGHTMTMTKRNGQFVLYDSNLSAGELVGHADAIIEHMRNYHESPMTNVGFSLEFMNASAFPTLPAAAAMNRDQLHVMAQYDPNFSNTIGGSKVDSIYLSAAVAGTALNVTQLMNSVSIPYLHASRFMKYAKDSRNSSFLEAIKTYINEEANKSMTGATKSLLLAEQSDDPMLLKNTVQKVSEVFGIDFAMSHVFLDHAVTVLPGEERSQTVGRYEGRRISKYLSMATETGDRVVFNKVFEQFAQQYGLSTARNYILMDNLVEKAIDKREFTMLAELLDQMVKPAPVEPIPPLKQSDYLSQALRLPDPDKDLCLAILFDFRFRRLINNQDHFKDLMSADTGAFETAMDDVFKAKSEAFFRIISRSPDLLLESMERRYGSAFNCLVDKLRGDSAVNSTNIRTYLEHAIQSYDPRFAEKLLSTFASRPDFCLPLRPEAIQRAGFDAALVLLKSGHFVENKRDLIQRIADPNHFVNMVSGGQYGKIATVMAYLRGQDDPAFTIKATEAALHRAFKDHNVAALELLLKNLDPRVAEYQALVKRCFDKAGAEFEELQSLFPQAKDQMQQAASPILTKYQFAQGCGLVSCAAKTVEARERMQAMHAGADTAAQQQKDTTSTPRPV